MIKRGKRYSILSAVGLCVRCSAGVSVAVMLLYLFQGLTPALLTLATGAFIDAAIGLLRSGEYADVGRALTAVSLLVSFDWISNQLLDLLVGRLRIDVRERFGTEMVEKVADLRYRYVENPESWDLITKISTDTDESILNAFQALLAFLALVWKALGLFLVMFRYVPAAALAVTACAVPLVMLSLAGGRASYAGISETQGLKRRYEYISRLLTGRDAAEERTLFGWAGYFNGEWESAYKKWLGVNARVNLKSFAKAKLGSISLVLIAIVVMTALLPGVVAGEITIGIFMALVSNIFSLVQLMSWSLLHSVSEIAKYNEFFHDVETFTKMDFREAESVSCELPEFSSLEFRDVTFAYPGTKRKVLDHLSFQISAGKSYSFVGANGCGKTTITKLIAGLYDDYEGQILINGTDIREWGPGRIAGFFSIVYQDFARYGLSLYENIAIGDVEKLCGDEINLVRFQDVVDMMELGEIVSDLKHGMETKLGKIVRDSEDLSGGQWQRVAIARCLVSDRPVKILDEPTAALDPAAESALYEKFRIINQKYTSVTISHRLASARQTDVIFVIENGRVCGSGSHETLYRENRLYREMYDSQRSWYQG